MNRTLVRALVALSLSFAALPAQAATSFEPGIHWRTLESAHFRVTYPQDLEALGRRVLSYAEDAHKKVAPFMKTTTYEKTEIVCFDTYDDTNANASNYQHNRINLNLHPPTPDGGLVVGRYDDWIRYVILHEYTHILHQNLTPWGIQELNAALGSIFFSNVPLAGIPSYISQYIPNYLSDSPRFITEGWAVTTESRFTTGGRAIEGDQDMHLRMATLENRLYTIDQVNGSYLLEWPSGGNEYDYGTVFFQYVMETYGEDVPSQILTALGKTPWLGIDFAVSQVLPGKSCNTLWDEMNLWMRERYRNQAADIKRFPLTEATRLTGTGRYHRHPKWLANGELVYSASIKGKSSGLYRQQPIPGAGAVRLIGKDSTSDYSMTPDGRMIYYSEQGEDSNRFTSYTDLRSYDSKSHADQGLTENMRASDPAVSPDGKRIAAVLTAQGTNYVALLDNKGKIVKKLTSCVPEASYANPAWSPDGSKLVLARWSDRRWNLVELDPETGVQAAVTTGNTLDFYPSYTADGRYIVFTSDRTGVFNTYAVERATGKMVRLTNVLGGAFEGSVSPDGKTLAFSNYSSKGFDIYVMPFDPDHGIPVKPDESLASDFSGRFVPRAERTATPVDMTPGLSAKPRDYSPWPSVAPVTYVPIVARDQTGISLGFNFNGQDMLRQHFYNVFAAYTFGGDAALTNRPIAAFYYQNDQLYPSLSLFALTTPQTSFYPVVLNGQTTLGFVWQQQQQLDLSVRLPGLPFPLLGSNWVSGDTYQIGLRANYVSPYALSTTNLSDVAAVTPDQVAPFEMTSPTGLTNSLYLNYQKADNFKPGYSISPEGGSVTSLGYEGSLAALGSVQSFNHVWADHRRYLSLPWAHHVLAVRGTAGLNFGKSGGHFILGGNASPTFLNQLDLTSATDVFSSRMGFRGYAVAGVGNNFALASSEYRFPLLSVDKGLWTLPVYLEQVYGVVGLDVGNVWDSPFLANRAFQLGQTLVGTSLELRSQVDLFRYLHTNLRLGVSQGLLNPNNGMAVPDTEFIMGFGNTY